MCIHTHTQRHTTMFLFSIWFILHCRLQELSACSEENPDYSDIELIQHINVDVHRLTKLLSGMYLQYDILILKKIYA